MDINQTQQDQLKISSKLPGPIKIFRESLHLYSSRFSTIAPIALLAFLAIFLQSLVSTNSEVLSAIAAFLSLLVTYLSYMAMVFVFAHENPQSEVTMTFYHRAWNVLVPYIWVSILVGVATLGGFVLFVIPGIIIAVYLCMAVYIVGLERLKGIRALSQSIQYVKGDWWAVFGRLLVFVVFIALVSIITSLITLPLADTSIFAVAFANLVVAFIVLPLATAYFYILYEALRARKAGPVIETDVRKAMNWLITIIVIGFVICIVWIVLANIFSNQINTKLQQMIPADTSTNVG